MWNKIKVMKFSGQLYPIEITIDQKKPKNVEYFRYFGSMISNDARCTSETESRIAIEFNKKKENFSSENWTKV
jgi:hypothetical protein